MIMPSASDSTTLVLLMKLREALKYADIELQRRSVISTKIRVALSDADTFLAQVVAEQPPSNASRKSADYDEVDTGRDKLDRPER